MAYYITNGNEYLHINKGESEDSESRYNVVDNFTAATHFKKRPGMDMLSRLEPYKHWSLYKVRNIQNAKNYVVTTATSFVSNKDEELVTCNIATAKTFISIADAENYIRTHDVFGWLNGEVFIFNIDNGIAVKSEVKRFTTEQLATLGIRPIGSTNKRITISKQIRQIVYENGNGICAICGRPVEYNHFTIDHILPLNRGGTNEMSNYQIACATCNKLKNDSMDSEYFVSATIALNNKVENSKTEEVKEIVFPMVRSYVRNMINEMFVKG